MKARLFIFVALWATVAALIFAAPGCYGRNCEGEYTTYGIDAGQGEMVSEDMWESSPQVGEWIHFPRQRGYAFDIRALGGRTPAAHHVYLSAASTPNVPGPSQGNQTTGAGNIALVQNIGPNRIDVVNDTCSDFYMRLVVWVPPFPPASPIEAGAAPAADADADAGTP